MTDAVQAAFIGAIVGAAVSALGALLATVINNQYAESRRKAEDRKWYAEHFLSRKINALSELYSSMVNTKAVLEKNKLSPPESYADFKEKVMNHVDRWDTVRALAWVYLSNDEREVLNSLRWQFRRGALAITLNLEDEQLEITIDASFEHEIKTMDWKRLDNAFEAARELMEELLSPDVLKGIEPEE
ncbi:MAG: hypothetical protein IIA51_08690 [Chloroflexi bacterium]|nr:hypothetical protein [Chloroflexota bacterium]